MESCLWCDSAGSLCVVVYIHYINKINWVRSRQRPMKEVVTPVITGGVAVLCNILKFVFKALTTAIKAAPRTFPLSIGAGARRHHQPLSTSKHPTRYSLGHTTGASEAVQHQTPGRGSPCGIGTRLSTIRPAPVRERGVQDIVVPRPCRSSPGGPRVGVGRGGAAERFLVGGGKVADAGRG